MSYSDESGLPPRFIATVGTVVAATSLAPRMRQVTIHAPELADLDCGSRPAPALRLLIPPPGHPVVMPEPSLEKGLSYPPGVEPPLPRTVTIRRYDTKAETVDVVVTTGHEGPLSKWISSVEVGAEVGLAGPRRFAPLPAGPLVLLGDESALPAIASIVEAGAGSSPVTVAIEVESTDDQIDVGGAQVEWVHRAGPAPGVALVGTLANLDLPDQAVVWVAGEAGMARAIRRYLRSLSPAPAHIRASGYWKSGTSLTAIDEAILDLTRALHRDGEPLEILDEFALAFEEA